MIKKDKSNGGVGSSPKDLAPEKKDWTIAIVVAAVVIIIAICAIV